jgi:drug/metabolite transporter (DMT)-like permease
VGAISIVAPIAGLAAVIPVAVGIASGDRPSSWQVAGMVCALGGVFLASREPAAERPVRESGPVEGAGGRREAPVREADRGKGSGETGRFPQLVFTPNREVPPAGFRVAPGVGLALLAALGFGGYFPTMHVAGNTDFWWASVLFRTTSTLVILVVIALRKPSLSVERKHLLPLALVGIGDMLGNLLFAAASTTGLVSVTSVLASLYPIVTVVMARVVVNERVARSQEGGIALTLAGVALISAG